MVSYAQLSMQSDASRFTLYVLRSTIRWRNRIPSRIHIIGDGTDSRRILSDGER